MGEPFPEGVQIGSVEVGIHFFLMTERIGGEFSIVVPGIDDQGIGKRTEKKHGAEHGFRTAEAAFADEEGVSGEEGGVVGGAVADGIFRMSRSCNDFDKSVAERESFAGMQGMITGEIGGLGNADRSREKVFHRPDPGDMVLMGVRQQDVSGQKRSWDRLEDPPDVSGIAARINDQRHLSAEKQIGEIVIESADGDLKYPKLHTILSPSPEGKYSEKTGNQQKSRKNTENISKKDLTEGIITCKFMRVEKLEKEHII